MMNCIDPDQGYFIRPAVCEDIPVLVSHHIRMFEEMWDKKDRSLEPGWSDRIDQEYTKKLTKELPSGTCAAWVVVKNNAVVASGAVSIMSYVPNPDDSGCLIGFLHSIYTERSERNHHHATRIVKEVVSFCKNKGMSRIYLFASDDGRLVYEKQGFTPVENMMQLFIPSGSGVSSDRF